MAEDIRTYSEELTEGRAEFEKRYEKPYCIVLDSQYCSMGRMIGMRACKEAGYAYYDLDILLDLVPEEGLTAEDVATYEQRLRERAHTAEELRADGDYVRITSVFDKAVKRALAAGPCLIHDRTTREHVRELVCSCVSVFTYTNDMDERVKRATSSPLYAGLTDRTDLERAIEEEDRVRANYHRGHALFEWRTPEQYDLMIDSECFGRDCAAHLLARVMR